MPGATDVSEEKTHLLQEWAWTSVRAWFWKVGLVKVGRAGRSDVDFEYMLDPFPVCFLGCVSCTSLQKQNQDSLGGTLELLVQPSYFTDLETEFTSTTACSKDKKHMNY